MNYNNEKVSKSTIQYKNIKEWRTKQIHKLWEDKRWAHDNITLSLPSTEEEQSESNIEEELVNEQIEYNRIKEEEVKTNKEQIDKLI